MARIYFDMDGTLAEWNSNASLEDVASRGYFRERVPMNNMINAVKILLAEGEHDIYILSSVYVNVYSNIDKWIWIQRYIPDMDIDKVIFVPYGESKSNYIDKPEKESDVLVDDYTKNLEAWHGIAVKCRNGINGNKGTWKGNYVYSDLSAREIADRIKVYAAGR